MSIMENIYFYSASDRQSSPAWYRLEKYDNYEGKAAKPGFFSRLTGRKRGK